MRNKNYLSVWVVSFLAYLNLSISESHAEQVRVISIDLDRTLIDEVKESEIKAGDMIYEFAPGRKIRLAPGAPGFIQALLAIPNVKIVFYSLGREARNRSILEAFKLPDGTTSFLRAAEGRLLSIDDMLKDPATQAVYNSNPSHVLKDLNKLKEIIPEMHLDYTIHIDDAQNIVNQSQKKNVLWLKQQHEAVYGKSDYLINPYWVRTNTVLSHNYESYDPLRMTRALGILLSVLEDSEKYKITPIQALYRKQWKVDPTRLSGAMRANTFVNPTHLLTPQYSLCRFSPNDRSIPEYSHEYARRYNNSLDNDSVILARGKTEIDKMHLPTLNLVPSLETHPDGQAPKSRRKSDSGDNNQTPLSNRLLKEESKALMNEEGISPKEPTISDEGFTKVFIKENYFD